MMIIPTKVALVAMLLLANGLFCYEWGRTGSIKETVIQLIKDHFE